MLYLDERPAQRLVNVPTATHHWPELRIFPVKATLSEKKQKGKNKNTNKLL